MKNINISFLGKPHNYKQIDNYLSRSAQPELEDFSWLHEQGVTDVINFRTLCNDETTKLLEKNAVESAGMRYHQIPSKTKHPTEKNITKFLNLVNEIINKDGKVHIHCKAGADRTGMYSYIYESLHNISTQGERLKEWLSMGHHLQKFPDLIPWTVDYVNKITKLK